MCYSLWYNTQPRAPEDGQDQCPKHVELIGIINKPLLLLLVGVYIIYVNDARSNKYQIKLHENNTFLRNINVPKIKNKTVGSNYMVRNCIPFYPPQR